MAFLAPPGVPGCLRDLEKNCKNSQKIYKKLTCIKIPQIIALRPILGYLDYPGGPQGGQKVIWWCKKFFLAESIWSFRQNTLYLSQVSGLGGHEPWFWLCPFTTPPYYAACRSMRFPVLTKSYTQKVPLFRNPQDLSFPMQWCPPRGPGYGIVFENFE